MMSLSPMYTFDAAIRTMLESFGTLGSVTCRGLSVHVIVLSGTVPCATVGHVGSNVPLTRIRCACHVTELPLTHSHVTSLSTTVRPIVVGQSGSVFAVKPAAACTAR